MVDKEIAEQTESCVRAKKMIVKQATVHNDDGSVSLGVAEPYNDKVMIPSGDELANVNPGSPVWVYWYFNNASTMHVALNGDGTQGSAVTDRLLEMLNKEIADREKADKELKSYIEITASHLRAAFADGLNSLRSYVELTASALRLEFHDDLNGLRSYLEMTASHLRAEFYDDLNSLRSYLELTASHLRAEFYDDLNSLRSYLELTASHLRAEFYDDVNSLRSYLELTASHLRTEFYDDINSLRSYVEITASHLRAEYYDDMNSMRSYVELTASVLRTEFYNDISSLRSYVEITASHLSAEFYNDITSLRSYVDIQAGRIGMNVAATDENASILRQAGMYINDQGVLVYATDNQNNIGSKLAVMNNEISAKVRKSEVVITDDSITIGSQSISFEGYIKATQLEAELLRGYDIDAGSLVANSVNSTYGSFDNITTDALSVNGADVTDALATLGPASSSGGQITIPYTTLGGGSGSVNFNIADTQYYIDGVAAAKSAMGVAVNTANHTIYATESATKSVAVSLQNTIVYNTSGHNYAGVISAIAGGAYVQTSSFVTGTEAFDAGAASVTQRTATSAGSITLSSSDTGYSVQKYTTVTYNNGTSTSNVPVEIDAHNVYAAGQASVTQRTANYVAAGANMTLDSTGKILSGTCSVYYDNGTYTTGVSLDVNATKAYNAGWAAAKAAISISGNKISGPSATVGSTEELYTITADAIATLRQSDPTTYQARAVAHADVNGTTVATATDYDP
jgi:hypothetical protein